jgi:PhoPQ-activated pathogenicity-related protein
VPILFVNGTNDVHYPLDSYQKSFDVVPGPKQMRIEVNMKHSHPAGWEPEEIGLFIDSFCRSEKPLASTGQPTFDNDKILMTYTSAVPLKSAALHYTTDTGLRSKRVWQSLPGEIASNVVTVARPPAEANTWFIAVTDQRDAMVTSTVQFKP